MRHRLALPWQGPGASGDLGWAQPLALPGRLIPAAPGMLSCCRAQLGPASHRRSPPAPWWPGKPFATEPAFHLAAGNRWHLLGTIGSCPCHGILCPMALCWPWCHGRNSVRPARLGVRGRWGRVGARVLITPLPWLVLRWLCAAVVPAWPGSAMPSLAFVCRRGAMPGTAGVPGGVPGGVPAAGSLGWGL